MAERTRAVLYLLADWGGREGCVVASDPRTCPNCGCLVESLRTPYCGDDCRETSAFIRQFRSAVLTGAIADPEKQVPLGQKLWRILGGGLPARVALVEGRTLERVIEKKGGVCAYCGAAATLVDNIGGG